MIKFLIQTKAAGWKANDWNLKKPDWSGKLKLVKLTLIGYPGALSVRQILFSFFWLEMVVEKFWENLTFIFLMYRSIFCEKKSKIFGKKQLEIVKSLNIFWKNWQKSFMVAV